MQWSVNHLALVLMMHNVIKDKYSHRFCFTRFESPDNTQLAIFLCASCLLHLQSQVPRNRWIAKRYWCIIICACFNWCYSPDWYQRQHKSPIMNSCAARIQSINAITVAILYRIILIDFNSSSLVNNDDIILWEYKDIKRRYSNGIG